MGSSEIRTWARVGLRPAEGAGQLLALRARRAGGCPGRAVGARGQRVAAARPAGKAAGGWAAGSGRGGAGRGAKGAGPRVGGGGGGGSRGGEHGGRGERLKCLASAACSPLLPRAEPAPGSFCIPPAGGPLLRRRGPESRGGGGRLGPGGPAPGPRSGGGRGGVVTVADERGAGERGPQAAAAGEWRAAGAEPPGGCSCHEPRGRRGPRGRGAAGTPPPPALLSPAPSTSHFSEFPSRPGAAGGGGGLSCHGHQLGAAPRRGKSLQQRLLSASFPVALVSAERASIRGGGASCAAARPAWGPGARGRRGKREPEVGAGAPRPRRRRDLGRLAHLSESRRPGPRNGGDRGVRFGRRSPRRRWCLTPARLLAPSPGKGFRRSIDTNGNVTGTDSDDKIKDHQARSCSRQLCFQMKLPTFKISTYSKVPFTATSENELISSEITKSYSEGLRN
nr:translation initiation factor IF-2-like [Saimiri boliviensis boliviensis]